MQSAPMDGGLEEAEVEDAAVGGAVALVEVVVAGVEAEYREQIPTTHIR